MYFLCFVTSTLFCTIMWPVSHPWGPCQQTLFCLLPCWVQTVQGMAEDQRMKRKCQQDIYSPGSSLSSSLKLTAKPLLSGAALPSAIHPASIIHGLLPFVFFLFFRMHLFIWKSELQRERDKEIFYLLVHFPDGYHSCRWSRLNVGARHFIQVSHLGSRDPSI